MSVAGSDAVFWVAVGLCAVAQFFILKAVLLPAAPPADGPAAAGRAAGRLRPASRPLEIAWVILPAVTLVWLMLWAWDLKHPAPLASESTAGKTVALTASPLSEAVR
jgi:hypothetical protein